MSTVINPKNPVTKAANLASDKNYRSTTPIVHDLNAMTMLQDSLVHLLNSGLHRANQAPFGVVLRLEAGLSYSTIKGVVHPQNDFLSSDYSCLGHLSSIVFFCICRISKIEKWF